MIPKECKRLAEVDFPIAEVSRHAAREKSIRHGHPSTLHLWWARRPLASCRSMLLALLLPDPCDSHCPDDFKKQAREVLGSLIRVPEGDDGLRKGLLSFIGSVANWDVANNARWVGVARGLVKAANPEETPFVVDPFAGGGSIPLEALRLGCDAFASDLNPVACLILKVMLEDIPHYGPEIADDLRRVGKEIKEQVRKELQEFYPDDPDGAKPIAYLWARAVRCEAPNCGAEIPLARSFWLSKKSNRKRALRYKTHGRVGNSMTFELEVFEPKNDKEVMPGTVSRAKAMCPCCNTVISPDRIRAQLREQRGGSDVIFDKKGIRIGGARLLAVVTMQAGAIGRQYRPPTESDYQAAWKAQQALVEMVNDWKQRREWEASLVPDEPLPPRNTLGLRVPNYGFRIWSDLFTARQKVALTALSRAMRRLPGDAPNLEELKRLLGLAISRTADYCSANCSLHAGRDVVRNTWARNALPIVWDYYESVPISGGSGNFEGAIEWISQVAETVAHVVKNAGSVELADACESPLPDESASIWFTDPPYYNAIGYAESSDFFYVWLKRALSGSKELMNPFEQDNSLTPKHRECIQDDTFESIYGPKKDAAFFENRMGMAFREGRRLTRDGQVGCLVFAHKTTEGWERLLSAMLRAGWVITASWPIHTEMENKVSGHQSGEKKAMLLASVHLVCRPRPANAPIGDWGEVIGELPKRVGDWMERLQTEGIRGADLVFACIGPALEIFSHFQKVEMADGHEVKLDEYLIKVWEVVGRTALEQILGTAEAQARNGAAGALEEDARLTALFLWTMQSTASSSADNGKRTTDSNDESEEEDDEESPTQAKAKGYSLVYDVVRRFAQPLGIALPKWEGRIIETDKGIVRLLSISERAKQLFGEQDAGSVADWLERDSENKLQLVLFPEMEEAQVPKIRGKKGRIVEGAEPELKKDQEATTLDRVHAAMLLQAGGKANALRALIKDEQERGQDFLRLANALSALYPSGTEEKRLLEAMLMAVPK